MKKGKLFVVSGPSGAGKSTITRLIIEREKELFLATSATTRAARKGEINGEDYYFFSKDLFLEKVKNGDFLEYACVHGNYYGTLKSEVEKKIDEGKNIILEIDVQGGEQVKDKFSETILVFVTTPSEEELKRRLTGRATDSEEVIKTRLENSIAELKYQDRYDYVIVNNLIDDAIGELKEIIEKEGGRK